MCDLLGATVQRTFGQLLCSKHGDSICLVDDEGIVFAIAAMEDDLRPKMDESIFRTRRLTQWAKIRQNIAYASTIAQDCTRITRLRWARRPEQSLQRSRRCEFPRQERDAAVAICDVALGRCQRRAAKRIAHALASHLNAMCLVHETVT